MMRAGSGDYDRWITLEAPLEQPDGFGGYNLAWQTHAQVWARRRTLRGEERTNVPQTVATATVRYELRHDVDGLSPKMRIVDDAVVGDITTILPAERQAGGPVIEAVMQPG